MQVASGSFKSPVPGEAIRHAEAHTNSLRVVLAEDAQATFNRHGAVVFKSAMSQEMLNTLHDELLSVPYEDDQRRQDGLNNEFGRRRSLNNYTNVHKPGFQAFPCLLLGACFRNCLRNLRFRW